MTDDLDRLRAALRASPDPTPQVRAEALRLAMENFDRLQETAPGPRPTSDSTRQSGVWLGVRTMLNSLTSRPVLAATTSIAALCVGLVVILPLAQSPAPISRPGASLAPSPAEAPLATPETAADTSADEGVEAPTPAPHPMQRTATGPAMTGIAAPSSSLQSDAQAMTEEAITDWAAPVPEPAPLAGADAEAFANADRHSVEITAETPVSTFSVDVDTASYAVVRSFLMSGVLPPPEAVRIEEMVNYFPYAYPAPQDGEAPFRPEIAVMPTPWNPETSLVRIGLQGRLPAVADRPPLNLVFLIDTSGSMQDAAKLPLLKQSFRLMLGQLRPEDQIAIVAYAGSAGEVLPPTPASDRIAILAALDRLEAGGATGGEDGLRLAYRVAGAMAADGEVSRVILATDGDFNLGLSDPTELEDFIAGQRLGGTYLSVLGFGRGNLDDATMQALAQAGNGTAAYIDTAQEARKVLVDQLTGALFPIADDVKIQVEWNPDTVAEWRLIGYETRALRREDFSNDRIDAGEIGAGHTVTALYEITAPGSPALRNTPLRYGSTPDQGNSTELGFLRLRWKEPGDDASKLVETPILPMTGTPSDDTRFAVAIAGFGQLLTGASYLGDWGWDQAIALAEASRGTDAFGYRTEAITLMRLAQSLDEQ